MRTVVPSIRRNAPSLPMLAWRTRVFLVCPAPGSGLPGGSPWEGWGHDSAMPIRNAAAAACVGYPSVGLLGHGHALPRLLLGRLQANAGALPAQVRGDRASIGALRCVSHCRCHTSCVAIGSEFDAFGRRSSAAFAKHGSSRRTAVQSAHRTFCEAGRSLESMARSARPRTGCKCRRRYLL
jgi:hypothetical protein